MPTGDTRLAALAAALLLLVPGCGRLSGGGGGQALTRGDPVLPPLAPVGVQPTGLVAATAGAGLVRLDWVVPEDTTVALYVAPSRDEVFAAEPAILVAGASRHVFTGLTDGVPLAFGLGVLPGDVRGGPVPTGAVLEATPGAPFFVDGAAAAGNGLTPETPSPSLLIALLTMGAAGGGNIWIAGGEHSHAALPLFPGTRIYGGFAPGFDLGERDPLRHPTRVVATSAQPLLRSLGGGAGVILDGLVLDGGGTASAALSASDTPLQVTRVHATACAGAGFRMSGGTQGPPVPARFVDCRASANGAEGWSGRGALDFSLTACVAVSNGQEGIDLDDLVAPDGSSARLLVEGSLCAGNGAEGLDVDLAAPPGAGALGGTLSVELRNVVFERNLGAGLLLDIEHDLLAGWRSEVLLRGVVARANGGPGLDLDLDGRGSTRIHRLRSAGNGGAGLRIDAESTDLLVTVTASALDGNLGAGIDVQRGQVGVHLVHSVIAGNADGGFLDGPGLGTALSSLAWRQPGGFEGAATHACAVVPDGAAAPLARVPRDWVAVLSAADAILELAGPLALDRDDVAELAEDGVPRQARSVGPASVALSPAPEVPPLLPAVLALFAAGRGGVEEDWRALPGSLAEAAGMAAPGGPPSDLGPHGLPWGGPPGTDDLALEVGAPLDLVDPPLGTTLGAADEITLRFLGATPDVRTVSAASVRVLSQAGTVLAAPVLVEDGALAIVPPAGGWPAGNLLLQLHAGLAAEGGAPLAVPLALTLRGPRP